MCFHREQEADESVAELRGQRREAGSHRAAVQGDEGPGVHFQVHRALPRALQPVGVGGRMGGLRWGLLGFPLLSPLFPFPFLFLSPFLLALGLAWQSSDRARHRLAAARGLPGEKTAQLAAGTRGSFFFAFFREGPAVFSWNAAASQNSRAPGSNYSAREQEGTPWR